LDAKQRENLAKYCYDISKIVVALLVIGPLARPGEISGWAILLGLTGAAMLLLCGLFLDKEK